MTFNPGSQLDPGQITDRRGMGGRGGLAVGGGGAIGLILLLAYTLLGGNPNDLGPVLDPGAVTGPGSTALATDCKTGQDANTSDECRILGYVNSVQAYWTKEFQTLGQDLREGQHGPVHRCDPERLRHREPRHGPVLLPARPARLSRPGFFDDLRTRFGAQGGSLAEGYVIAHEYGHHVQDLLGTLRGNDGDTGPAEPVGPDRAPGRLLRRRLGQQRGQHRLPPAADRRPDRGRARRGPGRRRRPDPEGDERPGQPRDVDARLVRPAPEVVHDGLPERRSGRLRHVQRRDLRRRRRVAAEPAYRSSVTHDSAISRRALLRAMAAGSVAAGLAACGVSVTPSPSLAGPRPLRARPAPAPRPRRVPSPRPTPSTSPSASPSPIDGSGRPPGQDRADAAGRLPRPGDPRRRPDHGCAAPPGSAASSCSTATRSPADSGTSRRRSSSPR